MNNARRRFLKFTGLGAALLSTGQLPLVAAPRKEKNLIILHTNDTHSQLEPFSTTHKQFPGMGGVAARKKLIDDIKAEGHPTLVLDCGDVFQGTPYFNFFHGEPEILAMNDMGYHASTIGNHEFDGGLDNIHTQLSKANFPFINSNYDVSQTVLKNIIQPYKIFVEDGIKIGVLGLGIKLEGLIPKDLCKGVIYNDPLETANKVSEFLKIEKKCDLIIVLSHLGYKYNNNNISDIHIAENTKHIDIILGGHTHTFMDQPDIRKNILGENVLIHQVGWAGVKLGRVNVKFSGKTKKITANSQSVIVDKKQIAF